MLLPAADGFTCRDHVVVDASYHAFPLLAELEKASPSPLRQRLLSGGRRLVAEAQFGHWRLPPDWLSVSTEGGSLSLAERQAPRFSFDACGGVVAIATVAAGDTRGRTQASLPAISESDDDYSAALIAEPPGFSGKWEHARLIKTRLGTAAARFRLIDDHVIARGKPSTTAS